MGVHLAKGNSLQQTDALADLRSLILSISFQQTDALADLRSLILNIHTKLMQCTQKCPLRLYARISYTTAPMTSSALISRNESHQSHLPTNHTRQTDTPHNQSANQTTPSHYQYSSTLQTPRFTETRGHPLRLYTQKSQMPTSMILSAPAAANRASTTCCHTTIITPNVQSAARSATRAAVNKPAAHMTHDSSRRPTSTRNRSITLTAMTMSY